jgi:hypothetical protein
MDMTRSTAPAPLVPELLIASFFAALASLTACSQGTANAEALPVSQEPPATVVQGHLQPSLDPASRALEQDDPELRRGYGVVDMRLDPCVSPQGDVALRGEACSTGFLIYGPYVTVPAKAVIDITFEVQPTQELEVYADVVAQMGKQELAGLSPQVLKPGGTYKLGYRVDTFRSDPFVESRIGFRAATPVEFLITNYTMTVR